MAGLREVRCCCDAALLGYLPRRSALGCRAVKFVVEPDLVSPGSPFGMTILVFEIGMVMGPDMEPTECYKSRDYPIEQLRRIRGWVDA